MIAHHRASVEPVHPRVCGERRTSLSVISLSVGSSPCVRGTHWLATTFRNNSAFIPACAENARVLWLWFLASPVHPRVCGERQSGRVPKARTAGSSRVCGERVSSTFLLLCCDGSSPRVRGTHGLRSRLLRLFRFIPACAGNAFCSAVKNALATVHPRVRGERGERHDHAGDGRGSSPRARGTLVILMLLLGPVRFIPACAGNATGTRFSRVRAAVHPRVRGERSTACETVRPRTGSSPRARGTRHHDGSDVVDGRFIPACAGNAWRSPRWMSPAPVHPRVRGERVCIRRHRRVEHRFIPACAGNAYPCPSSSAWWAVHPRVRGERFPLQNYFVDAAGSSPRARGTPEPTPRCRWRFRFIPACAGNAPTASTSTCGLGGSSPRARGTPHLERPGGADPRFIPACAGNASSARHAPTPQRGSSPRARGTPRQGNPAGERDRFIPACAGNAHGALTRSVQ